MFGVEVRRPALWIAAAVGLWIHPAVVEAQKKGRAVECLVESGGKVEFKGKCAFTPEKGGTFSLSNLDRTKPLYGSILDVSVYVVGRGEAEVRGLTKEGINSRWGEARRSKEDPACWVGSDFKICAR